MTTRSDLPLVSVLTPTWRRPEALALCREYVARQSYPHIEHVVIERPKHLWQKLLPGLKRCQGELVVVFEDDDWYHQDWVSKCVELLADADVAGQKYPIYYRVQRRQWFGHQPKRDRPGSSLCSTAFRLGGEAERVFTEAVKYCAMGFNFHIDINFWFRLYDAGVPVAFHEDRERPFVVGMKEMPGQMGYTSSHRANSYSWVADPQGEKLREWVGEDADRYLG